MRKKTVMILFVEIIFMGLFFSSEKSASASMICSSSFSITKTGKHRQLALAKKRARKSIHLIAHRRCQNQKLVYMAKWHYRCRKNKRHFLCRTVNYFRCCTMLDSARKTRHKRTHQTKQHRFPHHKNDTKRQNYKRIHRLYAMRNVSRGHKLIQNKKKNPKHRRHRKHREHRRNKHSLFKKGKKGWCSAQINMRGYGRSVHSRTARKSARKQARKRASIKCKQLHMTWMGKWHYRCTKSGHSRLCRAQIAMRCCQR